MNTITKVLMGLLVLVICALGFQYSSYKNLEIKYKTALSNNETKVEELKTIQVALDKANHRIEQKPKTTTIETIVRTAQPVDYNEDEVIKAYQDYIRQLEDAYYGLVGKEVEVIEKPAEIVEVIKEVPVEIDESDTLSQMREYISNLENEFYKISGQEKEVITREVIVDGGSVSEPVIIQSPTKEDIKKWTGTVEYKLDSGINLGVARKVYKSTSVGVSINTKNDAGVIANIQW